MIYPYGYPYISAYDSVYDPFGTLNLTQSDPPQTFVEPLALDDVKQYLSVDEGNTDDDGLITALITTARITAERLQNRDLVKKQWDLTYDYWPEYRVRLKAPTVSVDLVQYTDIAGTITKMTATTDYLADLAKQPAIITPPWNRSWPAFTPQPSSSVLIRFTSGFDVDHPWWSEAGQIVKSGMLLYISFLYENRNANQHSVTSELPLAVASCMSSGALGRAR